MDNKMFYFWWRNYVYNYKNYQKGKLVVVLNSIFYFLAKIIWENNSLFCLKPEAKQVNWS